MNDNKKIRVAFICSNLFSINKETKNGTAIFNRILLNDLHKYERRDLKITAFTSGDSLLSSEIESVDFNPSSADGQLISSGKHFIYELALISKAFSLQDKFDLFHVNIGDGDLAV